MKELACMINTSYKEDDIKHMFQLLAGRKPFVNKYHHFVFLVDLMASTRDREKGGELVWKALQDYAKLTSGKLTFILLYQYFELKYTMMVFLFPEVVKNDLNNHRHFIDSVQSILKKSVIQSSEHQDVFSILAIDSETTSAFVILSNSVIYDHPSLLFEVLRDLITNNVFQLSKITSSRPIYLNTRMDRLQKELGIDGMKIAEMKEFCCDHVDPLISPYLTVHSLIDVGLIKLMTNLFFSFSIVSIVSF